jgi:hypothetical protein
MVYVCINEQQKAAEPVHQLQVRQHQQHAQFAGNGCCLSFIAEHHCLTHGCCCCYLSISPSISQDGPCWLSQHISSAAAGRFCFASLLRITALLTAAAAAILYLSYSVCRMGLAGFPNTSAAPQQGQFHAGGLGAGAAGLAQQVRHVVVILLLLLQAVASQLCCFQWDLYG